MLRVCDNSRLAQALLSLALCSLATSCIPIDDLGEYWDKGVVDRQLEGHWKKMGVEHRSQDQYISFKLDGKSYNCVSHEAEETSRPEGMRNVPKPKTEARTLEVQKHRFLMVRTEMPEGPSFPASEPAETKPADRAKPRVVSGLLRYAFDGDRLVLYALDEHVLSEAIKANRVQGRIPGEDDYSPPSIRKLDQDTLETIVKWADDPESWKETGRYTRIPDIDKALAESRTYPATSQTAANTTVDIKLPDLKYLAEDKHRVLLRHLETKREVLDEGDEVICQIQPGWVFRFGSKPGGPAHWGSQLKAAGPLAGRTQLNLKSSDQGIESYLAVGQEGLWLEVHERTRVEKRDETRAALAWVKGFLAKVRESEVDIQKLGYAPTLIAADAIRKGNPSIEIVDQSTGFYEVRAWINPGADGRIYMKLFDRSSNTPFPKLSLANPDPPLFAGSKRRVGWSTDPKTLFAYKEYIFARSKSEQTFDTRVELWFKQEGSGKESKLGETTHTFVTSKPIPH